MMQHRLFVVSLLALTTLNACGTAPEAAVTVSDSQSADLRLGRRVIDLDALYNNPITKHYIRVAQASGTPCVSSVLDLGNLGAELASAILAQNYAAIATFVPDMLQTFVDIFACVKELKAHTSTTTPSAEVLPDTPTVPAYGKSECVIVIYQGNRSSTCAD